MPIVWHRDMKKTALVHINHRFKLLSGHRYSDKTHHMPASAVNPVNPVYSENNKYERTLSFTTALLILFTQKTINMKEFLVLPQVCRPV